MSNLLIRNFKSGFVGIVVLFLSLLGFSCVRMTDAGNTSFSTNEKTIVALPKLNNNKDNKSSMTEDHEYDLNLKLWNESNIQNYSFELNADGSGYTGPSPVRIEVRDGKASSVIRISETDPRPIEAYDCCDTVGKIFRFIKKQKENGAKVLVKYNKKYGYPEQVAWVYIKPGDFDSSLLRIKKFETLN